MMKVYEYNGFPNPARVRIALAELGLMDKVEFVSVDVPGGEHKQPDFQKKNPFAAVPVLELEDGTAISECTAITEYLDQLDGVPLLTGKGARERALIHMMQRRAETRLMDAVAGYFHHATQGLGPDIEEFQNESWGLHMRERAIGGMKYLDGVLANQDYIAGNSFSVADITAFAGLAFADFVEIAIPQNCCNLIKWRKRVALRPSLNS